MLVPTGLSKKERKAYNSENNLLLRHSDKSTRGGKHPGLRPVNMTDAAREKVKAELLLDADAKAEAVRREALTPEERIAENVIIAEAVRREALTDEERDVEDAEIDRRAALTDEERAVEDEITAALVAEEE